MVEQFIDFLKESFPKSRVKDDLISYLQQVYSDVASDEGYRVVVDEVNTDSLNRVVCLVPDDDDLTIFGHYFYCLIDGNYIYLSVAIGHFIPDLEYPTFFEGTKCLAKFKYNAEDQTLYDVAFTWNPFNCI